jgi:DNA invertase Pin-like site-specific DNA recombinase
MEHTIYNQSGGGDARKLAAQYIRMSTEHQKYSTENQSAAIGDYARLHGMTIVRTYADKGKSGLRIEGRDALKQLIADVGAGEVPFKFILVFDVSRWGRFQDADESAYYEYLCKAAGLQVRYCAEQFENDGSLVANLLKNIKRLMAGEYSRELSAKVFAAQCRLIALGFKQGGHAGYGLRRQMIDEERRPKALLAYGEQKSICTDRVVLVPGPDEEVRVVREIYRLFILQKKTRAQIARILNAKGILNEFGRPWRTRTVHQVLTNEKYIGNNVYNRRSFKLRRTRIKNSPDAWVRADGAFEPIIDGSSFRAARRIITAKTKHLSDEEALQRLRLCKEKHGRLSTSIIDNDEELPCSVTYTSKFGSLQRAFQLAGYFGSKPSADRHRKSRSAKRAVTQTIVEKIKNDGGDVRFKAGGLLLVDGSLSISVKLAICRTTPTGLLRWDFVVGKTPLDIMIAVRIEENSDSTRDYYLFPRSVLSRPHVRLSEKTTRWDGCKIESLDGLRNRLHQVQMQTSKKLPKTQLRGKTRQRKRPELK